MTWCGTLFVPSSHVENMAPKDKRIFRLTSECSLSCIISKGTYKGGIGERKPDNNTTDRAQKKPSVAQRVVHRRCNSVHMRLIY